MTFLVDRLPEHLAEDPFLVRFLGIFQTQADRLDHQVDGIQHVADPSVAPPEVVRWLGSWLGVSSIDPTLPIERQRELVKTAGWVLTRRGTSVGLQRLLEIITAAHVSVTDNGGVFAEGGATRQLPKAWIDVGATDSVTAEHLLSTVRREVPAGAQFELRIGGAMVWPEQGTWTGPPGSDGSDDGRRHGRSDERDESERRRGNGRNRRREPLRAAPPDPSEGG